MAGKSCSMENMVKMFNSIYSGTRVLVTGNTGFKGSWLTTWLLQLGAKVSGFALPPETVPNMFSLCSLDQKVNQNIGNIRDLEAIKKVIEDRRPEIVFHLAAQPLVLTSYKDPKMTWDTNVGGTVNLLEAVRACSSVQACVLISSDKCYDNKEWIWGYRENDSMGGDDPYSASKGAMELLINSYRKSFFMSGKCLITSARAGNVIGGGDWSSDRIVVDFVKAISDKKLLRLRNPNATRPWQHVLEPLSGYLWLGAKLLSEDDNRRFASAWNFGPSEESVVHVKKLAELLLSEWGDGGEIVCEISNNQPHEANLLKLDCSKATTLLGWHGIWGLQETAKRVVEWYKSVRADEKIAYDLTIKQIEKYCRDAKGKGIPWAL